MKKNKKKQILSLAILTSIGASMTLASPGSASADQISPIQKITQEQQNVAISDWREPFQKTYKSAKLRDPNRYFSNEAKIDLWGVYQSSVEADGSPTITNSKSLFVGRTILTNHTNQAQTLTTNEFSKSFGNSVTNSTTNGFNLGVSTSASFGIPLIGETGIEISTEYNFSNTAEKTKTESYMYTASPQNILVPANSSVEVIVNLNTAKLNGNVKLLSHVNGQLMWNTSKTGQKISTSFKGFLEKAARPNEIASNVKAHPRNGAYLIGKGKYSAEYGTEFSVTVRPVQKPSTVAAKSKSMVSEHSKTTSESYTYTVKPEVKKEQ
ncbi:ETX/MTX2 family pore-forming toxin [Bacillus thuringiensis]|nr:ETX/MTX2 family pore-forming toxin [Bacillus thuringiensis]